MAVTCRELIERIDDYLEDAMGIDARASFDRHAGNCGACREYVREYRMTVQLVRLLQ